MDVTVSQAGGTFTYVTAAHKFKINLGEAATQGRIKLTFNLPVVSTPVVTITGEANLYAQDDLYLYEWDHHNRLVRAHEERTPTSDSLGWRNANDFTENEWDTQVDYFFDVLGNRVGKYVDELLTGTGASDRGEYYVTEGGHKLLQFDERQRLTRQHLYAAATDELLAVETFDYDDNGNVEFNELVWTMADHQGTIRDLYSTASHRVVPGATAVKVQHLRNDSFGTPQLAGETETSNTLAEVVDNRYRGLEWDADVGLYLTEGRVYDPVAGRLLNTSAAAETAGLNPYTFAGNSPVDRNANGRAATFNIHATGESYGSIFAANYEAYNPYWEVQAGALAVLVGSLTLPVSAPVYIASVAGISLAETGVEGALAYATGAQFDTGASLGKNLGVNALTFGIGTGAKYGGQTGGYLLRQGIEIAGDTAVDVGVYGNDLSTSLLFNTVGSFGGEALGIAVASGARRAFAPRGMVPYGFYSADEFANFGDELWAGLRGIGIDDALGILQGSSVTGVRRFSKPTKGIPAGTPFDAIEISDLDVAISSPSLLQRAKSLGIPTRGRGTRSQPLGPLDLAALGLQNLPGDLSQRLYKSSGRDINFIITDSVETAFSRGPSIRIPTR